MRQSRSIGMVSVVLMAAAVLLFLPLTTPETMAEEIKLVDDLVTSAGSGSTHPFASSCSGFPDSYVPISANPVFRWEHEVGSDVDLSTATRAEIAIRAYDVDPPEIHDIFLNGQKIGTLPIGPSAWKTLSVDLDLAILTNGANSVTTASSQPVGDDWYVAFCQSSLLVYGEKEEPSGTWELFIDPEEKEVDPGEDTSATVFATFTDNCTGPISIDIDGSTSEYIKDATSMDKDDFEDLIDPDYIYVRLGQEELNSAGENNSDSKLDVKVGGNVPPGVYEIKVDGSTSDEVCGNEEASVVLKLIIGEVNVVLEKRQSKSALKPGMTQVYTLRIVNENSPKLTNLVITDTLDSRLEYVSDTSGVTPTIVGNTYTWKFNDLGRGETIEFEVTTKVDEFARQGRSISNRFEVNADQLPEEVVSNTVTATMGFEALEPDDLKVSKRLLAGRPKIGSILTYRIEVENVGGGTVFGVLLSDDPPPAFKIPAGKTLRDGKAFTDPVRRGGKYIWQLGPLAAGARTTLTYQIVIGTNADSGRNENCAEALGKDGGGNKVSGSDCAIVRLDGGDLQWLGQITAKAFLDVDNNGSRSASDEPLPGVEFILVPPGLKQTTDEEGETVFAELEAKSYVLALNTRNLDKKYPFDDGNDTELVRLLEGDKAEILFLIKKVPEYSKLVGRVFYDNNNSRKYDKGDLPVDSFTAILDNQIRTAGRKGAFIFSRLEPGTHVLVISQGDIEMSKVELDLTEGENRVEIPLVRPRLRITIKSGGDH